MLAVHFGPPYRLLILPTGSGDSTSLARGPIETYFGGGWLSDGKRIVFGGSEPGRAQRICVQDLAGGPPRPISHEGIAGWHVSADGRFVAGISKEQELVIVPVFGDSARRVAHLDPDETIIRWAADNRTLFVARKGTRITVSRIDVTTGQRTP